MAARSRARAASKEYPDTQNNSMPLCILLHLPRDAADLNAELATTAVKPAVQRLGLKLKRVPTHVIPAGMRDLQSDEVLCAESTNGISAEELRCLRWAVHKRHSKDVERVHRQLLCDLNNGDESRVKRKARREKPRTKMDITCVQFP